MGRSKAAIPGDGDYSRKPAVILICSLVYLLSPLGNFVFQWRESGLGILAFLEELWRQVYVQRQAYAIASVILWAVSPLVALGIFQVRLWGWLAFLVHALGTAALSLLDRDFRFRGLSTATFIDFPFFAAAGFFLFSEIRAPYFNPRLRWWRRKRRYRESIRVNMQGGNYALVDISSRGVFIADAQAGRRRPGERLTASINLGLESITARMEIVRVHRGGGAYPAGFGARFLRMDQASRSILRGYLRALSQGSKDGLVGLGPLAGNGS